MSSLAGIVAAIVYLVLMWMALVTITLFGKSKA